MSAEKFPMNVAVGEGFERQKKVFVSKLQRMGVEDYWIERLLDPIQSNEAMAGYLVTKFGKKPPTFAGPYQNDVWCVGADKGEIKRKIKIYFDEAGNSWATIQTI